MRWKHCPAFQFADCQSDSFCFPCTINYFGWFLKKLFQKVVQRVINMHYSSDPGNLVAFIKSFQNKWISVLMLCHNINATVVTKTTQEQVTVRACWTVCSEHYFLMFFFECFLIQKMNRLQIDATQYLSVCRF